jgi:hypothetical protein
MSTTMEDADRMWHVRGNAYRTLPVGFVQRWCDEPETAFTVDLVSGATYGAARLIGVSDVHLAGDAPISPIWLDFEFPDGERCSVPISAITSVTWRTVED